MKRYPAIVRTAFSLGMDIGLLFSVLIFVFLIPGGLVFDLLLVALFVFLIVVNGREVLRYGASQAEQERKS